MSFKVDNAIIMAAGLSSRFAPLSYEKPKALIEVKGEVLIERQINQLKEAGIKNIIIVTGYQSQKFEYLKDKYNVELVFNPNYLSHNNHYSLYLVKDYLKNSYICSADNYFKNNPFENIVDDSYYAAVYQEGETKEWCMKYDENNYIYDVTVGGENSWVMLGHIFFSEQFSKKFVEILCNEINNPETQDKLWENIYIEHLNELKMKIRKYDNDEIFEFDSLDELREFDDSFIHCSNSNILNSITKQFNCSESELNNFIPVKNEINETIGFYFSYDNAKYKYIYISKKLEKIK